MKRINEYLQGISQALFMKDPLFGALLLAAFTFCAPKLILSALFASGIGFAYSARYSTPYLLKHYGLMTINGFFFGIAMASQYRQGPLYFFFLITGSLILPIITKAVFEVLQHWKLSPFIAPYLFLCWLIVLAARGAGLETITMPATHASGPLALAILQTTFTSLGRMLFVPNAAFGVALFGLLLSFSARRAAYFVFGSLFATILAYAAARTEISQSAWAEGQYSFCAGLVGLGLASFPEKFSLRTIALFCGFSTFVALASESLLSTLQLPVLSAPYVATLWIACLSRVPKHQISWAPTGTAPLPALALLAATKRREPEPDRVA